jgi:hypothetical protein
MKRVIVGVLALATVSPARPLRFLILGDSDSSADNHSHNAEESADTTYLSA